MVCAWTINDVQKEKRSQVGRKERCECDGGKESNTVVLVGTFGGTPEPPCPGSAAPVWHRTWRHPVRR